MSRYRKNRLLQVFASQLCSEVKEDEGTLTMSSMSLDITIKRREICRIVEVCMLEQMVFCEVAARTYQMQAIEHYNMGRFVLFWDQHQQQQQQQQQRSLGGAS